ADVTRARCRTRPGVRRRVQRHRQTGAVTMSERSERPNERLETKIQQVNLMVSDLDAAVGFYTGVLGLGLSDTPDLGFPAQFIAINEYQQIHLHQLQDTTPERPLSCRRVADFNGVFARAKAAGVIETHTWGP